MILYKTDASISRSILQIDSYDPKKEIDRDGADNVVEIIASLGQKRAYFIEDSTAKFIPLYKELLKHNVDLCFGWRVTIVEDATSQEPQGESKIIIFLRNEKAWKKLIKLATYAQTVGKFVEPRLDYKKLHELWDDNLVICIPFYDSFIHKNLTTKNVCVPDFRGIPLYFFCEDNDLFFDNLILDGIKNYAGTEKFTSLVEAKSVYYRKREDAEIFQARKLMERKTHKGGDVTNPNLEFFMSREFCVEAALERDFKKNEEFEALFDEPLRLFLPGIQLPEFILEPDDKIEFNIEDNDDNEEILRKLCRKGYKKRFEQGQINPELKKVYADRVNYEIDVLKKTNFIDYILLIFDIVHFAKKNDLPIGRGRGSCCGALSNWLVEIDEVDPIPNKLFFERFINESRAKTTFIDGIPFLSAAPDVDLDCSEESRDKIVEYLKNKYPNRVCKLGTFNTYSTKSIIKDCGKIIGGYTEDKMKVISGYVPVLYGKPSDILETMEKSDKFKAFMEENPLIYKAARKLHGGMKSKGSHASAYIVSPVDLGDLIVLEKIKEEKEDGGEVSEEIVTSIDMKTSESMVIKVDLLGLDTLSLIHKTIQSVGLDITKFDFESPDIYKHLQDLQHTYGLFQISGYATHKALRAIKPKEKKHLVDLMALSRPGALMFTDAYADFVNGRGEAKSIHPFFDEVLKPYNNLVLFQEILLLCIVKFGFSLVEAEAVRRCVGKKDVVEMAKWEEKIYAKAEENGIDRAAAEALWKIADSSSNYSFNLCCCPTTLVESEKGLKVMSEIEIGDKILAYNVNDSKDHFVEVLSVFENECEIFEVEFDDGTILKCSMNHKILCEDLVQRPLKEILENKHGVIGK